MLATESVSIRPYNRSDDDFIAALSRDAFDEFSPHAVLHMLGVVRRCTTLVAQRDITPPRDLGGGEATDAGPLAGAPRRRRVGFAAFGGEGEGEGVLMLNAIAVVHRERGRGIGHQLMLAFERFGRVRGARRLELCTADCNLAALDLFYRQGFRLLRRRERFYDRGQDACILTKDLR